MGDYSPKIQNKVTRYITMKPILDLYKETVCILRVWVSKRWWEQEGLDLEGAREVAAVAASEGENEEEETGR